MLVALAITPGLPGPSEQGKKQNRKRHQSAAARNGVDGARRDGSTRTTRYKPKPVPLAPPHQDARFVLLLERSLVNGADVFGLNLIRDEGVEAQPAGSNRGDQPVLGLVDVPGAGKPGVRRLKEHVAVHAADFDIATM